MLQSVIDSILVLAVLLNLAMLATSRMAACIRTFALQSLLLALLPIAIGLRHEAMPGAHTFAITAGAVGLKVFLIPWVLLRVLRTGEIHREIVAVHGSLPRSIPHIKPRNNVFWAFSPSFADDRP
ncbi:MAG: hypothetical protein AAB385_00015 [Planctomycetota bacterium]